MYQKQRIKARGLAALRVRAKQNIRTAKGKTNARSRKA